MVPRLFTSIGPERNLQAQPRSEDPVGPRPGPPIALEQNMLSGICTRVDETLRARPCDSHFYGDFGLFTPIFQYFGNLFDSAIASIEGQFAHH